MQPIKKSAKTPKSVVFTEQEKAELTALQKTYAGLVSGLGNLEMQNQALQQQKTQHAVKTQQAFTSLQDRINDIAASKGINVNDVSQKWNVDLDAMTITAVTTGNVAANGAAAPN